MLRLTIHDSGSELRFHLEGRLAGPWVQEAALCWETAQSTIAGRTVVVDLQDLDFVDSDGERLLASMYRKGAELRGASPMLTHLIEEIAGGTQESASPRGEGEWSTMLR